MDTQARKTNTAEFGAGAWQIDATQYDQAGNVTWSLSRGNLAKALDPSVGTNPSIVTAPSVAAMGSSVDRANALASWSVYTPDAVDLTDTLGPVSSVVLEDGTTVDARAHSHTVYDEGAPSGGPFHLATMVTAGAQTADGVDHDVKTSRYSYARINSGSATEAEGWALRQPVSTTVVMDSGPNLTSVSRYNAVGQVTETRLPASPAGATPQDAHSSSMTYYTATGSGACVSAALAGMLCSTGPLAQPSTGKPLPVTTSSYNMWAEPLVVTETYGSSGVTRTTTSSYDPAARPSSVAFAVSPASEGGSGLGTRSYAYYAATGLPSTVQTSSTLSTVYDAVGAVSSYTDADGAVSKTTYDVDGRAVTADDGKGVSTFTYDGTDASGAVERRGLVTRMDAGTGAAGPGVFTGAYDPDGGLAVQVLPNGVRQQVVRDAAGGSREVGYRRAGDPVSGAPWLGFTAARSVFGQVRVQGSPASDQVFGYDAAGRLTAVADNAASAPGGARSCTTRTYGFDVDSNRTSQTSAVGAAGAACPAAGAPVTHSYDAGDRITDAGTGYDGLGRTVAVPAGDARGGAASVSASYYVNDMVAGLTQGSASATYGLDPSHSRVRTTTTGGTTVTNHYDGAGDSPSWYVDSAGNWTRNVAGLDGSLALQETGTGAGPAAATVQVTNLPGDVVALVADVANFSTSYRTYSESTEYGVPRTSVIGRYGWLGGAQRASDTPGALTLMGVRVYNPVTGRFLQVDPVWGGSANDYDYCNADPINCTDIDGQMGLPKCSTESGSIGQVRDWRSLESSAVDRARRLLLVSP